MLAKALSYKITFMVNVVDAPSKLRHASYRTAVEGGSAACSDRNGYARIKDGAAVSAI